MPSPYRTARFTALVVLALTLLVPAAPAWAHNGLTSSVPADGAHLATPPTQIVLTFTQRLDPRYTQIVVTDGNREAMPARPPTVSGASSVLRLDETLADGGYTVAYRVVSPDGHPVQGAFGFSVGESTTAAATDAAAPPPARGGLPAWPVVAAIAVVGAGLLWWRRARTR